MKKIYVTWTTKKEGTCKKFNFFFVEKKIILFQENQKSFTALVTAISFCLFCGLNGWMPLKRGLRWGGALTICELVIITVITVWPKHTNGYWSIGYSPLSITVSGQSVKTVNNFLWWLLVNRSKLVHFVSVTHYNSYKSKRSKPLKYCQIFKKLEKKHENLIVQITMFRFRSNLWKTYKLLHSQF